MSENGTCSMDRAMSLPVPSEIPGVNESCCVDYRIATNIAYRLVQASHVIFGILGVIFSLVYMFKYYKLNILPSNTKMFTIITLITIILHSVCVSSFHIVHILQSFNTPESNPCGVRNTSKSCEYYRFTYTFCLVMLVLNQYFLYIDRLLDMYHSNYLVIRKNIFVGFFMLELSLSGCVSLWVYRKAQPDELLLSCINVPLSTIYDVSYLTGALLPINCFCFFLSLKLFISFDRKVEKSRFNLTRHFLAAMNRDSHRFLRLTTILQSIFLIAYPCIIITTRLNYYRIPRVVHKTLSTAAYIFSLYCCVIPLAMVLAVRRQQTLRRTKIASAVAIKSYGEEGTDYYFQSLKQQWEYELKIKA